MPKSRQLRAAPSFSFRWGIPILDDLPYIVLYHFLLEHYAELGVDPLEMMFIIHLSQFRHETPDGRARPGLSTIATLMGYKDEQQVRRIKQRLIRKGLLRVTPQPGFPDVYDVAPFAAAAFKLWQAFHEHTSLLEDTSIENDRGIQTDRSTPIQTDRTPLSGERDEKESKEKTNRKSQGLGIAEAHDPLRPLPTSPLILSRASEHWRAFGEPGAESAMWQRVLRIWQTSGLAESAFLDRMEAAYRAVPGSGRMRLQAYWHRLEDPGEG